MLGMAVANKFKYRMWKCYWLRAFLAYCGHQPLYFTGETVLVQSKLLVKEKLVKTAASVYSKLSTLPLFSPSTLYRPLL